MNTQILLASIAAIAFCSPVSAQSLVENGKFAKPIKPWKVVSLKEAPATENSVADGVLTIKALGASDKPGNRQLSQDVKVEAGRNYTLGFDVKGVLEGETEFPVVITTAPGKFAFFKKIPIGKEWATQKIRVTPKEIPAGATPALKFLMGKIKGEVSIRNVTLVPAEGKPAAPPAPAKADVGDGAAVE